MSVVTSDFRAVFVSLCLFLFVCCMFYICISLAFLVWNIKRKKVKVESEKLKHLYFEKEQQ